MDRSRLVIVSALLLAASVGLGTWLSAGGQQGSPGVLVLEQSSRRTLLEISVPGIEATRAETDQGVFSLLEMPGEVMAVLEEGRPRVPKVSLLLAIPSGARVETNVRVLETQKLKVDRVYPLQPPLLEGQEPGPLVVDESFYVQDVVYPQTDARLVETGVWRDLHVANVEVYPVKVNPGLGEVTVATRVRVELEYSGGTYPNKVADWMVAQYVRMLDNFGHLRVQPLTDYDQGIRYLVFCHQNWASHSWLHDSLLGWVKKRGYDLRVITKSSFTAQEIKDSIRAEYNSHTPALLRHVLFVGEYAEIPMGSYSGVGRSDFWYTDLEPWPSGDNYPEVSLGRLSPDSAGCLTNQIKKILKYQKDPPDSNDWLTRLTMNAHREQYPAKYSGCIRGIYNMPKPFYDFDTDTIMGQYEDNQAVFDAMHAGTGYMIYRGHGSGTAWTGWCGSDWDVSTTYQLQNGDLTPVTHHFACICGDINIGTCLTEAWMRKYPGGAVSALGATQASYTYPNHGQCSTVVRAVADTWTITVPGVRDYAGPIFDVGGIMGYMDAYIAKYWPESPYYDNIYMYLTLGDPSTPAWSGGMPRTANVSYPAVVPLAPYDLRVTVTVSGQPVEDALVCAWKGTEFYVSERSNASGVATLRVNALTPGHFSVTVSEGHARQSVGGVAHTPILPYEGTCLAQAGNVPYVMFIAGEQYDSTPGGNADGMINPGEDIRVYTWVKNYGGVGANGVTGRLYTAAAGVSVFDTLVNYGNIAAEDSVRGPKGFGVRLDPGLPDDYLIPCSLRIRDSNDSAWVSYFSLRSYAASLYFVDAVIKDSGATWPNGRLDPGEEIELEVSVGNMGMGNSFEVRGVLKALDSLSVVTDTHALFGTVLSGSTAVCTDRFELTAHPNLPPESQLLFEFEIIWDHGNDTTVQFELFSGGMVATDPIPDGPRTPPLYFAYDDCDRFYTQYPTYDWVELRGIGTSLDLGDQETKPVALPDAFGPFKFYGERFDTISVCSNGWFAPGVTLDRSWQNRRLPTPMNRALIAVLWDDLLPPYGGNVLYWHDEDNNRFVIEWDSVHYSWAREEWDEFQVVIYDTTMAAADGHSVFTFQYKTANNYESVTVGEQPYWTSPDTIGIGCVFNVFYHRGMAPLEPGRAIKFTTDPPELTGVEEPVEPAALLRGRRIVVAPNPFNRTALVHWNLELDADVSLQVFDASGRVVRTLATGRRAAGTYTTTWNGRDDAGRELARGIYFVQLKTPSEMVKTKTVLAR